MTLQELAAETLVQKHLRLMRAKCKHEPEALNVASYSGPEGAWTDTVCVDCGSHWRKDHR